MGALRRWLARRAAVETPRLGPRGCPLLPACVRRPGHGGVCTACPTSGTLDWDAHRAASELAAEVLDFLDFVTPRWADLRDE